MTTTSSPLLPASGTIVRWTAAQTVQAGGCVLPADGTAGVPALADCQ
jgi:hypothetical protein